MEARGALGGDPTRMLGQVALVLLAAALAFGAALWIGGALRGDERGRAASPPADRPVRVTRRVALPAADPIPRLAPAARVRKPSQRAPALDRRRSTPAPVVHATPVPAPPPAAVASPAAKPKRPPARTVVHGSF